MIVCYIALCIYIYTHNFALYSIKRGRLIDNSDMIKQKPVKIVVGWETPRKMLERCGIDLQIEENHTWIVSGNTSPHYLLNSQVCSIPNWILDVEVAGICPNGRNQTPSSIFVG